MPNGAKRLPVEFFRTESGHEPMRDWLKSDLFSKEDRRRLGENIKTVERGRPIGMPTCRSIGRGLWEVRTNLPTRIVRVLFFIADGRMVLVHGFVKKSRATPQADVELAMARERQWESGR